jgi:DNA-directed RNA polymerase specialized sigma24 family protein
MAPVLEAVTRSLDDLRSRLECAVVRRSLEEALPLAWELFAIELARCVRSQGFREEDAADVLADAFADVLVGWARFDGEDLEGWVRTLVWYRMQTAKRKAKREAERRSALPVPDEAYAMEDPVHIADVDARLKTYLRELDEVNRMILDHADGATELAALVSMIERSHGVKLTREAIRARRKRMRDEVRALLTQEDRVG